MNEDSMAAQKSPAFQLYVKDYLADTNLRVCSLAARGLWMDLLCHMWLSERRGFLLIGGRKPTTEQLARIVGADSTETAELLEELARNDVYSVDDDGFIHSRRMVRDDQRRQQNILNGSKGGNPDCKYENHLPGFIYACRRDRDGKIKIGQSTDPAKRVRSANGSLRDAGPRVLLTSWPVTDMGDAEKRLHGALSAKGSQGEWFTLSADDISGIGEMLHSWGMLRGAKGRENGPAKGPDKGPDKGRGRPPAFASASAVTAAAGGCAEPPPPAAEARPADTSARVVAALEAAGIANPTLAQLAALPGLTPEIVSSEARSARERGKGIGALVQNIRAAVQKAKRRPTQRDRIGREEKGEELEQIRRQQELQAEADRQFDALGADVIEAYRREALQVCEFGTPGARAKAASADPKTHPIIRKFIDDRVREGRPPAGEAPCPCNADTEKQVRTVASEREIDATLEGLGDEAIEELRQDVIKRFARDFPKLSPRIETADPRTDPLLRTAIVTAAKVRQRCEREAVPA